MSLKALFLLTVIVIIPAASAAIQDLLNSYNYDFYNRTINVTSQSDYMIDKNNNGKNDTLTISITTDAASGTYKFIVEIIDKNGILVNATEKTISASDFSATINFPSELLSKSKFNYSIRINNNDNNLVFRKFNIESQTYKNYEAGTNITKIIDENIDNNSIRINLTIDSSRAITTNITVTLAYNSSTISKTEEKTLSSGVEKISIDFDNETIKSTHYNSNFTIDTVIVGNKIFDFNQNTSIYNYEDFAKTSYIKSIADSKIDLNNNNLSEFLEINFTVEVKTAGIYTISYNLYDQFDNFAANISKTQSLSTGTQNVQTLINGSGIYKTKINGPYVLSFAKLSIGDEIKDIVFDAHTTNQSYYTDYKKPNLPDLKVTINVIFNNSNNITNIIINLSNIGSAPAFNIFLDLFDNATYNSNATLAFLSKNDFVIYNFTMLNTSNTTLFTAIADFDNLIDESDESNNLVNSLTTTTNDLDGDGIADSIDNCPNLYNPNQITDFDGDGFDNALCDGLDCNDDDSSINPSATELCNGIDDNCNNQIDENQTITCGVSDAGICRFGTETCENGVWKYCDAIMPQQEVCNNLDDDCDNNVDEDFGIGETCFVGVGGCEREGFFICNSDNASTICNAIPGEPTAEICDSKDNNCDGIIDNNCARFTKEYSITSLENAKDGVPCKKRKFCKNKVIEEVITNIEKSLNPSYFIDNETLNQEEGKNNGANVFEFERKAIVKCLKGPLGKIVGIDNLCNEVADYLKNADKIFAEKALEDAKSVIIKNPKNQKCYNERIKKAEGFLLGAEDLISQKIQIIAINLYKNSWENSIKAIEIANSGIRLC